MNVYQDIIYTSRYAKWRDELGRRERYPETVDRYLTHISAKAKEHGWAIPLNLYKGLEEAILNRDVLPSMRGFMTAGPALARDEGAIYNCAFTAIDSVDAFGEIFFTLMLGTGVGFSVERKHIEKLPKVPEFFNQAEEVFEIPDSKEGWADALNHAIKSLYSGLFPNFNFDYIRPAGAPLKTFGGRASGPEPLKNMLEFVEKIFANAAGRQLTSLECHDIACKIAEIVVVGGVRRAAMISLSDQDDPAMRFCKAGAWWKHSPQRALANNSAVYNGRPSREVFDAEWKALEASRSGERGLFNRAAAITKAEKMGRDLGDDFGVNPCCEIVLRNKEFCNLTSVSIREGDDLNSLRRKVYLASVLGTLQSLFDDFRYISDKWEENQAEERLLGVSLSGIVDNQLTNGSKGNLAEVLDELRAVAHEANEIISDKLGIRKSAAVTSVKPEGTTSQMTGCSSGIHPAYAKHYIRRIRMDEKDPMTQFMIDQGMSYETDFYNTTAKVFSFPIKSSENSITRHDMNAIGQLELYLAYQTYWADHNVSNTVYVADDEWEAVGNWVYEHFNEICGVSFLPKDNGTYVQAPYEEIDETRYAVLAEKAIKNLDWDVMALYEKYDATTGSQEFACVAGGCEVTILPARLHEEDLAGRVLEDTSNFEPIRSEQLGQMTFVITEERIGDGFITIQN